MDLNVGFNTNMTTCVMLAL